mgnify:CR=1 FL=1
MKTSHDWAAHHGHRIGCAPASDGGDCLFCLECEVRLAHRPGGDAPAGAADQLPPLLVELVALAAGLRSMMVDDRTPSAAPYGGVFRVPGHPALTVAVTDDPYWRGYREGSRTGRDVFIHTLCQTVEDMLTRHVPAPDHRVAWQFVRAAVEERFRALREGLAARPGAVGGEFSPPPGG